jgi:hypothetical protein
MSVVELRTNVRDHRLALSLGALLLALIAAIALVAGRPVEARPAVVVVMPPARAAALIEATTGAASVEVTAVGDAAKVINASLPFATGPIASARPFALGGDALDQSRALLCLTQAVYYEAGFEPLAGRRAVAQVVLNRLRHPAYPKSVCGVVYQRNSTPICQFSFVCDGALYRAPAPAAWAEARAIAAAALTGYVETEVGSATHYHADYVAPRWAPMLSKVVKLGAHIFYRWPGAWGLPAAFTGRYIGEPTDPAMMRPAFRPRPLSPNAQPALGDAPPGIEIASGPPIARAANDVGGLLDTSKGWTLDIPDPRDTAIASAAVLEQQMRPAAPTAVAAAPAATAQIAARKAR